MTTTQPNDEMTIMHSDLSGKYYFVKSFYKDGRAKEKYDVTEAIQRFIVEQNTWHEIKVSDDSTYPPIGQQVLARMTYDNKKYEPIYIVVKHVDEDDCDWRTSDGDELSYWVNVTHWQTINELQASLNTKQHQNRGDGFTHHDDDDCNTKQEGK